MKQEMKKRLIFYFSLLIVTILLIYLLSPAPGPTRNMRQAQSEISSVEEVFEFDSRFSDLDISPGTGGRGTDIWIMGSVPDQESMDYLKSLMKKRFSDKFQLQYHVQIKNIPEDPNAISSG